MDVKNGPFVMRMNGSAMNLVIWNVPRHQPSFLDEGDTLPNPFPPSTYAADYAFWHAIKTRLSFSSSLIGRTALSANKLGIYAAYTH